MAATRRTGTAERDLSAYLLASDSCQPIVLARLFDSGKEYLRLTLLSIGVCACARFARTAHIGGSDSRSC